MKIKNSNKITNSQFAYTSLRLNSLFDNSKTYKDYKLALTN